MQSRHLLTVFACNDLWRMSSFYRTAFSWLQTVDEQPAYVEFELPGGQRIGLRDYGRFAAHLGAPPAEVPEGGLRPVELRLEVPDLRVADERLLQAGARLLSAAAKREGGDEVAYYADPEGNVLALVAIKGVLPPKGAYTRDEFVRRVSDLLRRSGVEDAETLVRDLESSVHFPLLARCGAESSLYGGARCVLLPGHEGYCEGAGGERWMRMRGSSG